MKSGSKKSGPGGKDRISLEECVARAMDGDDDRVVPFLPSILQDAWEIGTDPETVVGLVRRHARDHSRLRVLDLGCGKGAVTVRLAETFGCDCLGIDAIREFVDFAGAKAEEAGVARLCRFEVADMRERIESLGRYDVIVLGAIGPVFGDYLATLGALAPHLAEGGIVVVDDAYLPDDSPRTRPQVLKRGEMLRQVAAAGMRVVEEVRFTSDEIERADQGIFPDLERRCAELAREHPELKDVFEEYVRRQIQENAFLESEAVCVVLALKRQDRSGA